MTGSAGSAAAPPMPRAGNGATVPLDRRVLRLWRIRAGAGVVAVVGATGGGLGVVAPAPVTALSVGLLASLSSAGAWWWTGAHWRRWRFRIGDDALHLDHGIVTRHRSTIPYHRVQHIDLEAGPLERWLGVTTLILRTASATSDATVPGIDAQLAETVRAEILTRIGTGDAV